MHMPAMNISNAERIASAITGASLTLLAARRGRIGRAVLSSTGSALLARGLSGYCPVSAAIGRNTHRDDTRAALGGERNGIHVDESVTINASVESLYQRWRRLEDLPEYMSHLESVTPLDDRRSHWVARGPAGQRVSWEAEIINDVPNEVIGWRTLEGSELVSAGSVTFKSAGRDRGTELRVRLQYQSPAGRAGAAIAWLMGRSPAQSIRDDLRRFKAFIEAGEVPTTEGQPAGHRLAAWS
jgi:uncharacterized membrane protein